ncbi:MAG: L,D-transpeptidase family protein [Eggerthella sp.]|nr:L,D-transpeptidase family protein [Eggerthella sp.]
MQTGWLSSGGSWYWLDHNSGAMQTGWIKDDNGKWWFAEGSGALATSAHWVKGYGGSWYRVDNNGAMATGWRHVSNQWYWMDSSHDGKMAANELVNDNGTYYWCNSSGVMIRNGWCKDSAWHWASGSGAMSSGWLKIGGSWYWLDPSDPKHPMLTGLQTIDGSDYFFKGSGAMVSTCWAIVDTAGNARFASPSGALGNITRDADGTLKNNGVLCSGWVNLGGGAKTYADPISHKAMTGWIKDGAETYYINPSSGVVSTGWKQINGTWYLFNYSGKMLTNWQKVGGNWYYMDSSGAMQTGWLKTGDTWYYLNGSGAMLTGWQWIGSNWYYMNGSGAMLTGWQWIGSNWYYMNGSGAMQTGWLKQGGTWYWLSGSGAMATGWQKVGGTWYYFNSSGAWVPNPERAQMTDRIWGCNSGTQWLIAVNRSTHKVGIYRGSSHNWSLQYYVDCVTGAPSSPTITGTFRTSGGKRMALSTDSRAKWCTQISGGYFFHTILTSNNELGKSLSHGCIRMAYPDAQWIYNNIYAGTTVVIYG